MSLGPGRSAAAGRPSDLATPKPGFFGEPTSLPTLAKSWASLNGLLR